MKRFYVEYKVDLGNNNFIFGKYFLRIYQNHEHYHNDKMLNHVLTSAYHAATYVRKQNPSIMYNIDNLKVTRCVDAPMEVEFV